MIQALRAILGTPASGESVTAPVHPPLQRLEVPPHLLWGHLHALSILGDCGSFTAAARRLGCSKAAMSQRISELEAAAGIPLVRRTTRSVRLTEAGRQLADQARPAFESLGTALANVRDLSATPRGLLRVTAPVALAQQQILPLLPQFLQRFPEIRVEFDLSDRLTNLSAEGFDLAIRHTNAPPDTHVAWSLCEIRSVLVASPAYLARNGTPRLPSDLANHECLFYPRPGESPGWSFEPQNGGTRVTVGIHGPLAANNSEALRDAALNDLGIALLPDFTAQSALRESRLVEVLHSWKPVGTFGDHLWAIRPRTSQVPRAVQLWVRFLLEEFRGGFRVASQF